MEELNIEEDDMEELNIEELIEKIKNFNYCITIEDDLTEKIFKIEEFKEDLNDLIREKIGFCFIKNSEEYLFWKFNPTITKYNLYKKEGRKDFYLHDKLKAELDLEKISGMRYREGS